MIDFQKMVVSIYGEKKICGISLFQNHQIQTFAEIEINSDHYKKSCNYISKCLSFTNTIIINEGLKNSQIQGMIQEQKLINTNIRVIYINKNNYQISAIENNMVLLKFPEIDQNKYIEINKMKKRQNEFFDLIEAKKKYLRVKFNFQKKQIIKSLGALLYFLLQQKIITKQFSIENIIQNKENHYVQINKHTYQYLCKIGLIGIFKQDSHPSLIKGKGKSKQGYSVYNLYQSYIKTSQGKKTLKNWFLNPTTNLFVLQSRLNGIQFFKKYENQISFEKYLRNISDITLVLKRLKNIQAKNQDWFILKTSFQAILFLQSLFERFKGYQNLPQILKNKFKIQNHFLNIFRLHNIITQCINFESNDGRLHINNGFNKELDSLKKIYQNLQQLLTLYAREQLRSNSLMRNLSLNYLPQLGYFICLSQGNQQEKINDWQFQFSTNQGCFYKNNLTLKLDREYGDINGKIIDLQQSIFLQIQSQIIKYQESIINVINFIGQFDVIYGFYLISKSMVRPKYNQQNIIIKAGRHILIKQQLVTNNYFVYTFKDHYDKQFISTQKSIVNENFQNKCIIITGPNASGKSVYAKQIALIVFLALIGSYVPAQLANIKLVEHINSFSIENSIVYKKVGIQAELHAIYKTIKQHSQNSLTIIDQPGSRCEHIHGIAIVVSLIQQIQSKGISIIITHYGVINRIGLIKENKKSRFICMDYVLDNYQLGFLYKIRTGWYGQQVCMKMTQKFMNLNNKYLQTVKSFLEKKQVKEGQNRWKEKLEFLQKNKKHK